MPQLISKRYGEIKRKKKARFLSFKWLNCTQTKIKIIINIAENLVKIRKIVGQPGKSGMEIAPRSSFSMIRSGHGNPETSPLCPWVHVPYGLDTEILQQSTCKEVDMYLLKKMDEIRKGYPEIEYVQRNIQQDHIHLVLSFPFRSTA